MFQGVVGIGEGQWLGCGKGCEVRNKDCKHDTKNHILNVFIRYCA